MSTEFMREITSLTLMATALGMDVFSASIGMGMQNIRLRRVMMIGFIFGLFHALLPMLGILLGQFLSAKVGSLTSLAGGILLIAVGVQMILGVFQEEDNKIIRPYGLGLLLMATSVSIDSFSVGLGLGITGAKMWMTLFFFGTFSVLFTWIGMLIGRKVRGYLGAYSEMLGGSILLSFGIFMVFG